MRGEPGLAERACDECGCKACSWHDPGCSQAPHVCPGCFAFGGERCAEYCPDLAIARAREASEVDDDYERDDLNDSDDWEYAP